MDSHKQKGTTIMVYLPPQCPWEVKEDVMEKVADLVFGLSREGWDGAVYSQAGEV